MVIDDMNIVTISFTPFETDPPLGIDPDAVLAFSISFKGLKPVGRRDP
jgi:hypothetical protein